MSSGWSEGQGWYHVHMAYDARPTIHALALHDTVAVLAVSDTLSAAHTFLRGPLSRVTPP